MNKNDNFKSELETQYSILIKAQQEEHKKIYIIVLSILSITLIASIVSLIFAHKAYTSTKSINTQKTESNTLYQTLSTTYNSTKKLDINNITTGYKMQTPKVITVTNEGNATITFDIKLTSIKTSLLSTKNLVYTITENGETTTSKELPLAETSIVRDVTIAPKETIRYIINISYNGGVESNLAPNYYNANIDVQQTTNSVDLLE